MAEKRKQTSPIIFDASTALMDISSSTGSSDDLDALGNPISKKQKREEMDEKYMMFYEMLEKEPKPKDSYKENKLEIPENIENFFLKALDILESTTSDQYMIKITKVDNMHTLVLPRSEKKIQVLEMNENYKCLEGVYSSIDELYQKVDKFADRAKKKLISDPQNVHQLFNCENVDHKDFKDLSGSCYFCFKNLIQK